MDKCKYCQSEDLVKITNYEYQFEEDNTKLLNVIKCNVCNCIHSIVDDKIDFFEFEGNQVIEHNTSGDWKI